MICAVGLAIAAAAGDLVHVGHQDGLGERGLVVEAAASLAVATRTDLGGGERWWGRGGEIEIGDEWG